MAYEILGGPCEWLSLVCGKLRKKLDGWAGNTTSIGGRFIQIQASLSGVPIYLMSMYLLHDTNLENITKIIRKFFWANVGQKKKYHMVKWQFVCRPREKGGLGIKNLKFFNIALLCKWWWRLENEDGLWQELVRAKYGIKKDIWSVKFKQNDSPVWKDLQKVKKYYIQGRKMIVIGGNETNFWHDAWLGDSPLCESLPQLYEICEQQQLTVREMADRGWNMSFRRWLGPAAQQQAGALRSSLMLVALGDGKDKPWWKLCKNGKFTVKSMYKKLSSSGVDRSFKFLWKAAIPLKIKIWLWLIWHNAIATKDNMRKRKWEGNYTCRFCPLDETISHLFFTCPAAMFVWSSVSSALGVFTRPTCFTQFFWWIAKILPFRTNVHVVCIASLCWAIWKLRNRACFEGKLISSPVEMVCYMCVFMRHWAGLQKKNEDKVMLEEGADRLQQVALEAYARMSSSRGRLLRIDEQASGDDGSSKA